MILKMDLNNRESAFCQAEFEDYIAAALIIFK
jgi:hypothetical protein